MTGSAAAGFWSYAHADNSASRDDILRLASQISSEYDLITGRSLRLFLDRNDIQWGQNWRDRILTGLKETTFFIPIISPRYFNREECRRELQEFLSRATSLGLESFVLPIIYVPSPDLVEASPDQLIKMVASLQRVDWTENRFLDPSSGRYREAINKIVSRLVEIEANSSSIQISNDEEELSGDVSEQGVLDIRVEIDEHLPAWLDAVLRGQANDAQYTALRRTYDEQRTRLGPSAGNALLLRLVDMMTPVADQALRDAQEYSARSIALDVLVRRAARLGRIDDQAWSALAPVREAVNEAIREIDKDARRIGGGSEDKGKIFARSARLSKKCAELARRWETIAKYTTEGNGIVGDGDANYSSARLGRSRRARRRLSASRIKV